MDTTAITLSKNIILEDLHRHLRIDFEVPEKVTMLTFNFSRTSPIHNWINYMIYDTEGYRGWSDRKQSKVILKEDYATPGYIPKPIKKGRWHIILDVARLASTCQLNIDITYTFESKKWYKGDMHTHTNHSDGLFSIEKAVNYAKDTGLDFIALTDHNTYSQNYLMPAYEDFTLLPGVELTTSKGHVNFIGLNECFKAFRYDSFESLQAMFEEGYSKGAFISINHPFIGDKWRWGFEDLKFHSIEIWNGTPLSRNLSALKWWQDMLSTGHKITGTGGSDIHEHGKQRWYGQGMTYIQALSNNRRHLHQGLLRGRVCVASHPLASQVFFTIDTFEIGDTIIITDPSKAVNLMCELYLLTDCRLKVYGSNGLIHKVDLDSNTAHYDISLPSTSLFYRLELWRTDENGEESFPFFTNPIYLEHC